MAVDPASHARRPGPTTPARLAVGAPVQPVLGTAAAAGACLLGWDVGLSAVGVALGGRRAARLARGRLMPPPCRIGATLAELAAPGELWTARAGDADSASPSASPRGRAPASRSGRCRRPSRDARRILDPTLQALRAVPSIAWVPLFILWLGIFEASKVALIAVGVFFPVYLGVAGAIPAVDRKLVEVGRVFRLSRSRSWRAASCCRPCCRRRS